MEVYGTDALKSLLARLFRTLPLDTDGDGETSKTELFSGLSALIPSFFAAPDLIAEIKDLHIDEVEEVFLWAADQFPVLSRYPAETKAIIADAARLVACSTALIKSISVIRKKPEDVPVDPAALALQKTRTGLDGDLDQITPPDGPIEDPENQTTAQ